MHLAFHDKAPFRTKEMLNFKSKLASKSFRYGLSDCLHKDYIVTVCPVI